MYKIIKYGQESHIQKEAGTHIPIDDGNTAYKEYKKYLKDNNIKEKHLDVEDITPKKSNLVDTKYDTELGKLVFHDGEKWEIVP
jgi:hypothetical protein